MSYIYFRMHKLFGHFLSFKPIHISVSPGLIAKLCEKVKNNFASRDFVTLPKKELLQEKYTTYHQRKGAKKIRTSLASM